jgi:GNAT superfamily N-acetyltransferase
MPLHFRINHRPLQDDFDKLCVAVGWSPFGDSFDAALDGYSATASAWTEGRQLVAWTSMVSDNVRHAFLLDVMVHPEFQRKGIGRQVVHLAIEAMRERGVNAFHVDCAPDRRGFYEQCGFTLCAGGWIDATKGWKPVLTGTVARSSDQETNIL